jgi:hypothetical protein
VSNELSSSPPNKGWQREISIAAATLGFGLIALPFAIYFVGQRLLGEYRADAGAMALAEAIWLDLLSLSVPAWILVLSPYATVQLLRWVKRLWWPRSL